MKANLCDRCGCAIATTDATRVFAIEAALNPTPFRQARRDIDLAVTVSIETKPGLDLAVPEFCIQCFREIATSAIDQHEHIGLPAKEAKR